MKILKVLFVLFVVGFFTISILLLIKMYGVSISSMLIEIKAYWALALLFVVSNLLTPEMEVLLRLILTGLFVGTLTGMTGASGVLILFPILSLPIFHLDPHIILGTSLMVDVIASLSVSSTYYATAKNVDIRASAWILLGAIGGVLIGSFWMTLIPDIWLKGVIAFGMIAFGIQTFRKRKELEQKEVKNSSLFKKVLIMIVCGIIIGTSTGAFGAGGGLMVFIILFHVLRFPLKMAIGTSTLVMLFTAAFGTIGCARHGNVDFHLGIILGFSAFIGGLASSIVAYKVKEGTLIKIIGIVFVVAASIMAIFAVLIPLFKIILHYIHR